MLLQNCTTGHLSCTKHGYVIKCYFWIYSFRLNFFSSFLLLFLLYQYLPWYLEFSNLKTMNLLSYSANSIFSVFEMCNQYILNFEYVLIVVSMQKCYCRMQWLFHFFRMFQKLFSIIVIIKVIFFLLLIFS